MIGVSVQGIRQLFVVVAVGSDVMTVWPRSAYVVILGLLVTSILIVCLVHIKTRNAYREVGVNDGKIQQRAQTMMDIQEFFPVADCNKLRAIKPPVEFLTVKAESLYIITAEDESVLFCR